MDGTVRESDRTRGLDEICEKDFQKLRKKVKVNVELKRNCGYLLGVCYFGLPVEPRLMFSLPLLELLLTRLKRNAKIICDGHFYYLFSKAKPLCFSSPSKMSITNDL